MKKMTSDRGDMLAQPEKTENEYNVLIARILGWKEEGEFHDDPDKWEGWRDPDGAVGFVDAPDYYHSFAACEELIIFARAKGVIIHVSPSFCTHSGEEPYFVAKPLCYSRKNEKKPWKGDNIAYDCCPGECGGTTMSHVICEAFLLGLGARKIVDGEYVELGAVKGGRKAVPAERTYEAKS